MNWQGIDVGINARLQNGLTVQGGTNVASNAVIAAGPQPLGRPLSGGANVTVNLIQPGTLYGPVCNNFDLRLANVLKFGPTKRAIISVDVHNLSNSDTVLAYNNSFVPDGAWLTPTRIAPARYMKLGGQFDF